MRFGRRTTVRYIFFFFFDIPTKFGLSRVDAFYIVEREIDIEGVDVATNATTVASAFTRYTVAPSTMFSQTTRMTGYVFYFLLHIALICALNGELDKRQSRREVKRGLRVEEVLWMSGNTW